ncbi:MAG TPA: hypothetical protein VGF43_07185 [Dongiaceae bacterium]|jgi:hypothetical protein
MMMKRRPLLQGHAAEQPSSGPKDRLDQAARLAMKQDRARDAERAMQEYQAERRAVVVNTERLRALRLAREANSEKIAQILAKKD